MVYLIIYNKNEDYLHKITPELYCLLSIKIFQNNKRKVIYDTKSIY